MDLWKILSVTLLIYLCLVAFVTAYNLRVDGEIRYGQKLESLPRTIPKIYEQEFLTVDNPSQRTIQTTTNCFERPYRCSDETNCDCTKICLDSNVEELFIWDDDEVFFNYTKLPPGLYCVPKLKTRCKRYTSSLIYNEGAWKCHCTYPQIFSGETCSTLVACKIPEIRNNKNVTLWDNLTDSEVTMYERVNFYEFLPGTSKSRYSCKCDAEDNNGNPLIFLPELPLNCFVDYCKNNILRSSAPGFDRDEKCCDCGNYEVTRQKHLVFGDESSPCTNCINTVDKNEKSFTFHIPCFNVRSNVSDLVSNEYPCADYENPKETCNYGTLYLDNIDNMRVG